MCVGRKPGKGEEVLTGDGGGDRNVVGEEKPESRRVVEGSGEGGFTAVVGLGSRVTEQMSRFCSCSNDQSFGGEEKAAMAVIRRGGNRV